MPNDCQTEKNVGLCDKIGHRHLPEQMSNFVIAGDKTTDKRKGSTVENDNAARMFSSDGNCQ